MKRFEIRHKYDNKLNTVMFSENNPPAWLVSAEYLWFWNEHVLPMSIGATIETDFKKIKRVE